MVERLFLAVPRGCLRFVIMVFPDHTYYLSPVKYFTLPFQGSASFVDHLFHFCLVLLCFRARLFIDALWSPARKGLTSWLSFVMSNCEVVTFPLVSWARCGA